MEVIVYGNEKLRQHCAYVVEFDDNLKEFADEMYDMMVANNGIGLAASQVGSLTRLVVIDTHEDEENGVRIDLVNPKISAYSVKTAVMEEGCLSIPDVYANVKRPTVVKVKAKNLNGEDTEINAKGLLARVMQHAIDHLNGVLFVDRLDRADFERVRPALELIKQGKKANANDSDNKDKNRSKQKRERVKI